MGSKSSAGLPGSHPRASRSMPSRYAGGAGEHWSDSDAPLIAGHYLAGLLRPHAATADGTRPQRALLGQPPSRPLAAWGQSQLAALRRIWLSLRRGVAGSANGVATGAPCLSATRRQGRGSH